MQKALKININGGWLGASLTTKLNLFIQKEQKRIVGVTLNRKNPVILFFYGIVGILTLGFYVPMAGYVVVVEDA